MHVDLTWDLLKAVNTTNVAKRGVISSLGCFLGEMRLLICRLLYDLVVSVFPGLKGCLSKARIDLWLVTISIYALYA